MRTPNNVVFTAAALTMFAVAGAAHAKPCPNVMLVLDQSASMAQDPNGGTSHPSKWELLQKTITDVVRTYGDHVPFGLELFSSAALGHNDQCFAETKIDVELSHSSGGDIIQKLAAAQPLADTNTGEAVKRARMDMALMNTAKPNYIIIVTDGDPNCNTGDLQGGGAAYTTSEILAARMQSPPILTFVVGFDGSGGLNPLNLDRMAAAGGTRIAGCQGSTSGSPCYYSASNADAFKAAIDKIVTNVGGEFGAGICDDSCYTLPCGPGMVCTTTEIDPSPHCENDPCGGANCSSDQFCRLGKCVNTCRPCGSGQSCSDGHCAADPCLGKKCPMAQVCDPSTGACIDSPCPICQSGSLCNVATAKCVTDQCKVISCPKGTSCVNNGNCVGAGGGCSAGASALTDGWGMAWLVLLLLCLAAARARRGERKLRG